MPLTIKLPVRSSERNRGASTSNATSDLPSASGRKKKNWRDRLRESRPEEFEAHLKLDAMKSTLYRLDLKGERKQHYNEMAKLRMKKFRKKNKEAKLADLTNAQKNKKTKPATRQDQQKSEEIREREKLRKREQRAAMSQAKRNEINRKRREKRQEEKLELLRLREQQRNMQQDQRRQEEERKKLEEEQQRLEEEERQLEERRAEEETTAQLGRSKAAKRKSLSRALKSLPSAAVAFTDTLIAVMDKAAKSPRKVKEMNKRGLDIAHREVNSIIAKSLEDQLGTIKKSTRKKNIEKKRGIVQMMGILKKYRLQGSACKRFGISPNTIRKHQISRPKCHKRRLSAATKDAVVNFYIDWAVQLPDKKLISKKTLLKTGFLQEPISQVYTRFKEGHPEVKIGIKKFYQLRPKHIKVAGTIKYRGCLCEYCTNIDLKAAAINQVAHCQKKSSPFQGVHGVTKVTMCPKEGKYNKRCCVARKCKDCGTYKLKEHLKDVIDTQGEKLITWKRWDKITSKHNGTTVSKQVISTKEGSLTDCVVELAQESETITDHLFTAYWQNDQFSHLTKNLPPGWIVLVLDFAENYTCKYQDEIQSAHWYHTNATVHPIVAYYACPHCNDTMQESIVMISADKIHDFHAVNNFMEVAVSHLKSKLGNIQRIVRFSDGCGAQYKSRGPFFDMSCAEQQYGLKVQHDFFGSRHGKGPSDGESAVVKRQASQAVLGGTAIINDARGLFEYCNRKVSKVPSADEECMHFQRVFYYADNIDRDRGFKDINLYTVKGTRRIHNLRGIKVGQISARNLSCFCRPCTDEKGSCENAAYVDDWWRATVADVPVSLTSPKQVTDVEVHHVTASSEMDSDDASRSVVHRCDTSSLEKDSSDVNVDCNNLPASIDLYKIEVASYVAVKFQTPGKKCTIPVIYMAIVQERKDDMLSLKFMRRNKKGNYFWPEEKEHVQPVEDVVAILSPPSVVHGSRGIAFDFDEKELHTLQDCIRANLLVLCAQWPWRFSSSHLSFYGGDRVGPSS